MPGTITQALLAAFPRSGSQSLGHLRLQDLLQRLSDQLLERTLIIAQQDFDGL